MTSSLLQLNSLDGFIRVRLPESYISRRNKIETNFFPITTIAALIQVLLW